jgi:hypothetical protein
MTEVRIKYLAVIPVNSGRSVVMVAPVYNKMSYFDTKHKSVVFHNNTKYKCVFSHDYTKY